MGQVTRDRTPAETAPARTNGIRGAGRAARELDRLRQRNAELEAQVRELAAVNRGLRSFVADAAHELVEPLVIVESVALELKQGLGGTARNRLETVGAVSARSRLLVESLLHEARAGQCPPELKWVDVASIVRDALALVAMGPRGRPLRFSVGPLPTLVSNPEMLSIVMRNLLVNAVRYSSDGPAEIAVTSERLAEGWRLSVISPGPAIAPDDAERLLRRFERGPRAGRSSGTGLGLAICQRIMERLGGTLGVAAEPLAGNRFFVFVPAAEPKRQR
jgi:signal transduction histidine kinase